MTFELVHDATFEGFSHLPNGLAAGYTTGSGIAWTPAMFAEKPGAVRIDQDPAASDPTADVLDVESEAATFADCPKWAIAAHADISARKRIGQRVLPVIYMSKSNVTNVVNALISGGVTSGVGLWVAFWTGNESSGQTAVTDTGPFPIIGCQFDSQPWYDSSVFDTDWLSNVVVAAGMPHYSMKKLPPGQWEGTSVLSGIGTDGNRWHTSTADGKSWSSPRRSLWEQRLLPNRYQNSGPRLMPPGAARVIMEKPGGEILRPDHLAPPGSESQEAKHEGSKESHLKDRR
jgi:hypothetical protein